MLSAQYLATSTQLQGLQKLITQNIQSSFGLTGSSAGSAQTNSPTNSAAPILSSGSLPPGAGIRFSANA